MYKPKDINLRVLEETWRKGDFSASGKEEAIKLVLDDFKEFLADKLNQFEKEIYEKIDLLKSEIKIAGDSFDEGHLEGLKEAKQLIKRCLDENFNF